MRKLVMILGILLPFFCHGQSDGIKFEKDLSWTEIKEKAKAENKYIFVDCYATWCGPCKWMAENVFSDPQVSAFYNSHFINVSVQMDKTAQDNDDVKKRYDDAAALRKEFNIHEYPNYLFISPDGQLVHRLVGKTDNAEQFAHTGKSATNRDQQYITLINNYTKHSEDSTYLFNALKVVYNAGDQRNAKLIFDQYLASLKQPVTPMVGLMADENGFINSTKDNAFKLFVDNASRFDTLMHKQGISYFVEGAVKNTIFEASVKPFLNLRVPIQWGGISKQLKKKYPSLDPVFIDLEAGLFGDAIMGELASNIKQNRALEANWEGQLSMLKKRAPGFDFSFWFLEQKANYYNKNKLYAEAAESTFEFIKSIEKSPEKYKAIFQKNPDWIINGYAYGIILPNCSDNRILTAVTATLKKIIEKYPDDHHNIDTYANFLYKTGKVREAIDQEKLALNLAERGNYGSDIKDFTTTLEKMKNGRPTW